jgi:hypothetical protein
MSLILTRHSADIQRGNCAKMRATTECPFSSTWLKVRTLREVRAGRALTVGGTA